ncbi:MAG TPA: hypothetical protein VMW48_16670, partial [Vicinamibacterales bacterium]|nr:hypothetical protein [Vicinamibacterales bacterium]
MNEVLAKALTPTNASTLQHDDWSPILTETAFRDQQALMYLPIVPNRQGTPYKFNRRTAMPGAYPEGSSAVPQTVGNNSSYDEVSVDIKIIRSYGVYDKFLGATARQLDVSKSEVLGAAKSVGEELCGEVFWGDTTANAYEFDGFDAHTAVNRVDFAQAKATCDLMDQMKSLSMQQGTRGSLRMYFMSDFLRDAVSQHCIRTYKHDMPVQQIAYPRGAGGLTLDQWQGIPILPVSFTRPLASSGAITVTGQAYGGTIADGVYYVTAAAVTRYGEQLAATPVLATISGGGGAGSIDIVLPGPFSHGNINGAWGEALYWKIYVSAASGASTACTLRVTTNALTYSAAGSPTAAVTAYTYTGANTARGGAVGTATAGLE